MRSKHPPPRRRLHTMSVTVSAPSSMTVAQVRREIRTLINEQCNYLSVTTEGDDVILRVRNVTPSPHGEPDGQAET